VTIHSPGDVRARHSYLAAPGAPRKGRPVSFGLQRRRGLRLAFIAGAIQAPRETEVVFVDWEKLQAALIRFFWASVFPAIGWFGVGANLEAIGVPQEWAVVIAAGVAGVLYGVKKYVAPDAKF